MQCKKDKVWHTIKYYFFPWTRYRNFGRSADRNVGRYRKIKKRPKPIPKPTFRPKFRPIPIPKPIISFHYYTPNKSIGQQKSSPKTAAFFVADSDVLLFPMNMFSFLFKNFNDKIVYVDRKSI
jgi:hypothetical protein